MSGQPYLYEIFYECGMIIYGDLALINVAAMFLSRSRCYAHPNCHCTKIIIGGNELKIRNEVELSKILIRVATEKGMISIKDRPELIKIIKAIGQLDHAESLKLIHTAEAIRYRSLTEVKQEIDRIKAQEEPDTETLARLCAILELVERGTS